MSHIHFVRDGLKKEIEKREKELEALHPNNPFSAEFMDDAETAVRRVTIDFLKGWIRDNKALLTHLEICCKEDAAKDKKASDDSWITNPDRMGGAYAEDELRDRGWK